MTVTYSDALVTIHHGNALALPLEDASVDLVVTSPPYFGLRSYQDGGEHYAGQIGSEATPAEFVDALIAATAEMVRVLKPSGSIWVNLGDKYNAYNGSRGDGTIQQNGPRQIVGKGAGLDVKGIQQKSLIGIPWRYALRCIDDLGLILRAEVIWSKPNGLPESVTDRVRRSHETWFHFTVRSRYFSAVDEVREEHKDTSAHAMSRRDRTDKRLQAADAGMVSAANPLGKLPGSVWDIPTQPLRVPDHLGIDHFAAFPMEFPRRIIRGWSPSGVCVECGEGRRPVAEKDYVPTQVTNGDGDKWTKTNASDRQVKERGTFGRARGDVVIVGEACACPEPTAPTRPAVVLDPFGGTGTTALVARSLGRRAVHVDLSADYCRLAQWRLTDAKEAARALKPAKPREKCPDPSVHNEQPAQPSAALAAFREMLGT